MPYCNDCAKYWTPNSMNEDGTCPRCGIQIEDPPEPDAEAEDDPKVPWHFKLMVVALVIYLGWRFIELGIDIFT